MFVPSTISPNEKTHLTFVSLSRITISSSLPFCSVHLLSSTQIILAGVSEAILTASSNGIPALLTITETNLSIVARLPASDE